MAADEVGKANHTRIVVIVVFARVVAIPVDQVRDGVAEPVPPAVKRPAASPSARGPPYVVVAEPACTPVTVEPSLTLPQLSCGAKQAEPLPIAMVRLARP